MAKQKRAKRPPTHSYNPLNQVPDYDGTVFVGQNNEKTRGGDLIWKYLMYKNYLASRREKFSYCAKKKTKELTKRWRKRQRESLVRISYYDAVTVPLRRYLAVLKRRLADPDEEEQE